MSLMKEQEKTPEGEKKTKLNEMEASDLPETEFKIIVIRMLNELMGKLMNTMRISTA